MEVLLSHIFAALTVFCGNLYYNLHKSKDILTIMLIIMTTTAITSCTSALLICRHLPKTRRRTAQNISAMGNAVTKAWKLRIAVLWCFTFVVTGKQCVQSAINVISYQLYNLPFQILEIVDRIGVITFYICQVSCLTYCIKQQRTPTKSRRLQVLVFLAIFGNICYWMFHIIMQYSQFCSHGIQQHLFYCNGSENITDIRAYCCFVHTYNLTNIFRVVNNINMESAILLSSSMAILLDSNFFNQHSMREDVHYIEYPENNCSQYFRKTIICFTSFFVASVLVSCVVARIWNNIPEVYNVLMGTTTLLMTILVIFGFHIISSSQKQPNIPRIKMDSDYLLIACFFGAVLHNFIGIVAQIIEFTDLTAYFKYSMLLLNIYLQILFDHKIRSILRLLTRHRTDLEMNVASLNFIICSVFAYNLMCWIIDVALLDSFLNEHRHLVGESSWMAMK